MRRTRRQSVTRAAGHQEMPRRFLAEARGFTVMELLLAASVSLIVLFAVYSTLESTRGTYDAGESRADIQQQARVAIERMARELRLVGYGFPSGGDCNADTVADNAVLAATPTSVTFCADITNASTTLVNDVAVGGTQVFVQDASGMQAGGKGKGKGKGVKPSDEIFLMAGGTWEQATVTNVDAGLNRLNIDIGGGGVANAYSRGIPVGRPKPITYCWNDSNGLPGSPNCGSDVTTLYQDEGEGGGFQLIADSIQTFQLRYFDDTDTEILPADLAANLANIRRIRITMTLQSAAGWLGSQTFTVTSNARLRNL
ncbi:MAG: PilW family protein [Candidatus Methylomirabilales bacterium]